MAQTYVVGYDATPAAIAAMRFAARMADATRGEVVAVATHSERGEHQAEAWLAGLAGLDVECRAVRAGSPVEGLSGVADERQASLVVVGATQDPGSGNLRPGSVGELLLRRASCPVAVVPPRWTEAPVATIAVAYGGPESAGALHAAKWLMHAVGAQLLLVVGVYEPPALRDSNLGAASHPVSEGYEEFSARQEAEIERIVDAMPPAIAAEWFLSGPVGATLVDACRERVDLLVVGARAHGPQRGVPLGSVSHYVVEHAPCPVLVVPHDMDPWPDGAGA
jgi:nucleotide-binding universal stress UspA family protein